MNKCFLFGLAAGFLAAKYLGTITTKATPVGDEANVNGLYDGLPNYLKGRLVPRRETSDIVKMYA